MDALIQSAIASASLTHSIARACSVGDHHEYSCGKLPNEAPTGDFKWGGCGDDTEFGLRFSELFTAYHNDKMPKNKKTMMNSHNTAAGNKFVYDSHTTECKCHGVSGSFSIKTCWKALADFGQIAETLKNKYGTAIEVKSTRKHVVHKTCDPRSTGPGGCDIMCCSPATNLITSQLWNAARTNTIVVTLSAKHALRQYGYIRVDKTFVIQGVPLILGLYHSMCHISN